MGGDGYLPLSSAVAELHLIRAAQRSRSPSSDASAQRRNLAAEASLSVRQTKKKTPDTLITLPFVRIPLHSRMQKEVCLIRGAKSSAPPLFALRVCAKEERVAEKRGWK